MVALFKYFVGVAATLSAVVIVFALNAGEIFGGSAGIARGPAIETPRWQVERPKTDRNTPYVTQGSLSPIYPATPGKELMGKLVNTVSRVPHKFREPVSAKRIDVHQALQLHNVPRQIYAASEQDRNYPQQSLSYADTRPSQPPTLIIFGHGIY
jgi:hypothetical protein